METMRVWWLRDGVADDGADAITSLMQQHERGQRHDGALTTDHPASSYGLPVFVADDGRALGPADLPRATVLYPATETLSVAEHDVLRAARAAGYQVYHSCDRADHRCRLAD